MSKPKSTLDKQLTVWDYEKALFSQSACNLSGLVHALSEVVDRIWVEARLRGEGTEYVNNHPIVRLYVEQLQHLCKTSYADAHSFVSAKLVI
ncbi:MAG: hypothetical protein ACYTBS_24275 [Planctomycetota bacterium]|jgi:hypothetical protein